VYLLHCLIQSCPFPGDGWRQPWSAARIFLPIRSALRHPTPAAGSSGSPGIETRAWFLKQGS
jgi:hypothetical protein